MPDEVLLEGFEQPGPGKNFRFIPPRRRANLDWISCKVPPDDLTPFEEFTRNVDWANTFFGHPSTWDEQLRSAFLQLLADPDPAALLWGDRQHMIYNEAYIPLVGQNHPRLQGKEPRPIFGDIWNDYEANYRTCEATGGFVSHPALLTMMTRYGYEEECYFGFKWAPFIGRDGNLKGVYASCSDTTEPSILTRRLNFIRELAAAVTHEIDFSGLWASLASKIETAAIDLPSVMIYSNLDQGATSPSRTSFLHLEASVGVPGGGTAAPWQIVMESNESFAPAMRRASATRSIVILREVDGDIPHEVLDELEPRSFNQRSTELAICPIFSGQESVCFLIVGLSPKKRYDTPYHNLLQRLTDEIIGPRLGSILLAYERERGRDLAQKAEDERNLRIRELEQSELKYRQFAEHAPLGMVRLDTKGNVEYANAAWKVIFDVHADDSNEQSWRKKIHPDHHELAVQFFDQVCKTKGPLTFEHKLVKTWDGQSELDRKMSAQPTWLLVTGYLEDESHIICWITDISAQKAAATALNEKMEDAILQRTRQENFIDMISHEIRNPMSAVLHCTEDIINVARDLLDKQPDSLTPALNGCLESAQTILYCIEHQKRIIDDVLTLSKLDADLLEIALVPVEPRKVIRTALRIFERELKESKIKLTIVEDTSLEDLHVCVLQLDPNRFLQIIINLVTNGIKFTRTSAQREITVKIAASTTRPTPDDIRFFPSIKRTNEEYEANAQNQSWKNRVYLIVSVSDTGKGLSDTEHQHLFNRFAQASPKTHIEYGGSGLGLFISRQITEMMGGQIGIKQDQKIGCTFAFFVQTQRVAVGDQKAQEQLAAESDKLHINVTHHPVTPLVSPAASSSATPQSWPSPKLLGSPSKMDIDNVDTSTTETMQEDIPELVMMPADPGAKHPIKVLVVEDNLINQKVVCKQLKARGFDVHAANHGVEALKALQSASYSNQRTPFDLVLCDIEMPVMNGIVCAQEVRRLESEGLLECHIPILCVTANARSIHVQEAIEAGMDDVTTKPYRMDELVAQIEHFVRKTGPRTSKTG